MHAYMHTYVHTYIHTGIRTYIHADMHTYIYSVAFVRLSFVRSVGCSVVGFVVYTVACLLVVVCLSVCVCVYSLCSVNLFGCF